MSTLTNVIIIVGAGIVAVILGYIWAWIWEKLENRKMNKNFKKFLEGKKENKIFLEDGRILDVNRFITFDEAGNKICIELKGGIKIKKYENDNEKQIDVKGRIQKKGDKPFNKNKRFTGAAKLRRRLRRG